MVREYLYTQTFPRLKKENENTENEVGNTQKADDAPHLTTSPHLITSPYLAVSPHLTTPAKEEKFDGVQKKPNLRIVTEPPKPKSNSSKAKPHNLRPRKRSQAEHKGREKRKDAGKKLLEENLTPEENLRLVRSRQRGEYYRMNEEEEEVARTIASIEQHPTDLQQ